RSWSVVDESFTGLQSMQDQGELSSEQSLQWGQALEKLGQYEKAAALLEPLVSAPPASKPGPNDSGQQLSAQVSRVLGRVYEELGQFARAAETEESFATNTHPDIDNESRAEAWYRAGVLHYRRPDCIDEAKRCLDEALQCVSSHLPALDTLEQIANAQEDHERLAVILGRKIAPLRKHPKRQRSLLSRLAQLQEHKLGRPDVAQQTYQRILDICPDYRPALTFMEARAAAAGRSAERYQLLLKLAGKLPSDSDESSKLDEYQSNRKQALYWLATTVQTEAPADPSQSIALFTSALGEEEDDKIWRGLQACYEQQDSWREVADVLGQRLSLVDEKEAATIALQRIEILTQRLGDYTTALIALRVAQQRHPTDEALANWKNQPLANAGIELEPSEPTLPTQPVPSSEAQLYRALANEALVQSRFSEAFDNFDKAIALAPHSTVLYEEYADAATTAGEYRSVAEQLLALSELPDSADSAPTFIREHRGDLYLQLAQLNYDKFSDQVQARQYMRMAADAFGNGVRRATTLRQLATEAAVSGALRAATDAYEALGIDTLADHEALCAANLYHRLSRGHSAVRILESLRASNSLSDEGRALLLTLNREQHHKRELADNLQNNLEGISDDIVLTRLREALRIYQDILADVEAATHVRDSLRLLGDTGAEVATEKQLINLAQAAEDAADNDPLIAVSLLSRALGVGYQDSEDFTDVRSHALLDTLRSLVQHPHLPERDSATREVSALVQSLLLASTHSEDSETKITLLCEVAQLRRNELHDTRAAADALFGALSISPENPEILALLVPGLQESSDYALLVRSYELHLGELSGRDRIETLLNLGRVYQEVFRESVRSQECFDEAKRLGGDIETAPPLISSYNMSASEVAEELEKAAAQEALGNIDDARAIFESAAATAPRDPRAFEALRRIYTEQRESTKLARVLEQLTTLSDNPIEKAALFYQRADLARTEFHDEVLVYEYLKEAAANSPDDLRYSHGLRTICMARGEWALAAELTYREIAAQVEDNEKGALYLELALIFDEKLLDVSQALVNYEQALQLDPDIRAAPRPLARLYELAGRHADAFPMYKKAAAISPDSFESGRLLRHAAMSAEQAGMTDEALSIYEKVAQTGSMQDAEAAVNAMERIDGTDGSGDKSS
ncbi:MAG: hypothetical protein JKY56_18640, partial [Kofleriaceae bacterium]|nr:hypothetical protein [Kofleriaceae bacterium]